MKYNFPLAKTVVPVPVHHTHSLPTQSHALFAHTISVSDALSHFLAKAKHVFLVTMTRLFLRATIHAQRFRSILWYLVFLLSP